MLENREIISNFYKRAGKNFASQCTPPSKYKQGLCNSYHKELKLKQME